MPVFQKVDPLSAASDAVGSFFAAKRQKALEDAAAAHTASRDARQDMESDRSYGIQQSDLGLRQAENQRAQDLQPGAVQLQKGEIQAQGDVSAAAAIARQKDLMEMANERQLQPLVVEGKQIENKHLRGELVTQADAHRLAVIQNNIAQITANHADNMAQLDAALKQAQIAEAHASAASSNASAWRTRNEPFYNPNATTNAYSNAINSLSPAATAFVQHLQSSGTSMTPIQAELQVRAAPGLTPSDKSAIMTILNGSSASDFQPLSGKQPKSTGYHKIDALTQSAMYQSAMQQVQAGKKLTDIYNTIAKTHGISPAEVEGILDDQATLADQ